jgi:starch-binding outer membrane protein, SusD/RagB family
MKCYKIIISGILICLLSILYVSCEKEILDKDSKSAISEKDVWGNITLAEMYLNRCYPSVGHFGITDPGHFKSSITDDGTSAVAPAFLKGEADASTGGYNSMWTDQYRYIKDINVFLQKIDEVTEATEEKILSLKSQARFLRANCYADLVNWYSWWRGEHNGVPIITEPFELHDDFQVRRDSYEDVISFIVAEVDAAKEYLPEKWSDDQWGRITKGACLALKAQQLLYAASKLHNPEGNLEKWQKASDAAKAVIDMDLYELVPVESWKDYAAIFLEEGRGNTETILARLYLGEKINTTWIDQHWSPNGYDGWGNTNTTQALVDAFEMDNGKMINEEGSGYNPQDPYVNRELRFYANVVYNGREYRGRKVESYLPEEGSNVSPGMDTKQGPIAPWNASATNYTPYKYMDERLTNVNSTPPNTPYIVFRLAEIFLKYAEAQWHLGNEPEAREYVNKVRRRSLAPEINSSGADLLEDIKHERRIELASEKDYRWCDVRRWEILEETVHDVEGMEIFKDDDGNLRYERKIVQPRTFYPKQYSLPIPLAEIQKTDLLQNPGY